MYILRENVKHLPPDKQDQIRGCSVYVVRNINMLCWADTQNLVQLEFRGPGRAKKTISPFEPAGKSETSEGESADSMYIYIYVYLSIYLSTYVLPWGPRLRSGDRCGARSRTRPMAVRKRESISSPAKSPTPENPARVPPSVLVCPPSKNFTESPATEACGC